MRFGIAPQPIAALTCGKRLDFDLLKKSKRFFFEKKNQKTFST